MKSSRNWGGGQAGTRESYSRNFPGWGRCPFHKEKQKTMSKQTNTTTTNSSSTVSTTGCGSSKVAISSRKIEDSQKPAIEWHPQKRVGQMCVEWSYIFCFCLDKHKFLPTPSCCQRHVKRNKSTFSFRQKINCAAADSHIGVVLGASQTLLRRRKRKQYRQYTKSWELCRNQFRAVRRNNATVKFPKSWVFAKDPQCFFLGVTHISQRAPTGTSQGPCRNSKGPVLSLHVKISVCEGAALFSWQFPLTPVGSTRSFTQLPYGIFSLSAK